MKELYPIEVGGITGIPVYLGINFRGIIPWYNQQYSGIPYLTYDNCKQNTIGSYGTKKFATEYQRFELRFCMHRNEFNCIFRCKKLCKYVIYTLIWSYEHCTHFLLSGLVSNNFTYCTYSKWLDCTLPVSTDIE